MPRMPLARRSGTTNMKLGDYKNLKSQGGKIGYILLWLLGIPIPILIGIFLLRGCT